MDPELQEILAAWLNGELDPARAEALLARLRSDETFRRAFIEELRMLGMLKAVQSSEPRWLRLEAELNLMDRETSTTASAELDSRILKKILLFPNQLAPNLWKWAAVLAIIAAIAAFFVRRENQPRSSAEPPQTLAVAVKLDGVVWESAGTMKPVAGGVLHPGWLRLRSGRISLAFLNGATLEVEGPAELKLISMERIYCDRGRLRAYVLPQSAINDFTILSPGAAVVDIGTEFGYNVQPGQPAEVMVLEGSAEASVLAANTTTLRSQVLTENASVKILPETGEIHETSQSRSDFLSKPAITVPELDLSNDYIQEVMNSKPWGYWRFESMLERVVTNEIANRPVLHANGSLTVCDEHGGNHSIQFNPGDNSQFLQMDGTWPEFPQGYAVEFLFASEEYKDCSMVSVLNQNDEHSLMVELTARGPHHLVHNPGSVRYVYRQPPSTTGGLNIFSSSIYYPYRWHHIVAQRTGRDVELFFDGVPVGRADAGNFALPGQCSLLIGRLRFQPVPSDDTRTFAGHLDEFAIYDHPLSAQEISRHASLALTTR